MSGCCRPECSCAPGWAQREASGRASAALRGSREAPQCRDTVFRTPSSPQLPAVVRLNRVSVEQLLELAEAEYFRGAGRKKAGIDARVKPARHLAIASGERREGRLDRFGRGQRNGGCLGRFFRGERED